MQYYRTFFYVSVKNSVLEKIKAIKNGAVSVKNYITSKVSVISVMRAAKKDHFAKETAKSQEENIGHVNEFCVRNNTWRILEFKLNNITQN